MTTVINLKSLERYSNGPYSNSDPWINRNFRKFREQRSKSESKFPIEYKDVLDTYRFDFGFGKIRSYATSRYANTLFLFTEKDETADESNGHVLTSELSKCAKQAH